MANLIKRLLLGKPLPSHAAGHQRLGVLVALAVFASDALSSVAYATEEILWVLVAAGAAHVWLVLGIAAAIIGLLAIVVVSYHQTIEAYPSGGGAYIVAKDNLGKPFALTAGAALLVDYVLTAAVSVTAGVAAITSAFPTLAADRVAIGGIVLMVVVVMNLRGVKESARIFALPTYAFLAAMALLVVWGLVTVPFHGVASMPVAQTAPVTAWVFARAFASGCTALTGVEAISNGVSAFAAPEAENANRTLRRMAFILGGLFAAITVLALLYGVVPSAQETVISQLGRRAFGTTAPYYFLQGTTALILLLAANTSFADFPRLGSLMARDSLLPRQLANLGDRLAFSNGIVVLAALAFVLVVIFDGRVHALIPLYAVGVFLSFSISQTGMVVHWLRRAKLGHALVNTLGALACTGVLAIVIATKFSHGAWAVCVVIPLLAIWFLRIERHYRRSSVQLRVDAVGPPRHLQHTVVIPVSRLHKGVLRAVEYARSLTPSIRAVTVEVDEGTTARLREEWGKWSGGLPLEVVASPYRSLVEPLVDYLDRIQAEGEHLVTVVIPEFVPRRLWHRMLHNQSALLLVAALSARPDIVVTTVRIPLED